MKAKKRSFTLIEVVVALGLASIALFFLFTTLRNLTLMHTKLAKERASLASRDFFYQRLLQISSKIDPKSLSLKHANETPSLHCIFDNGADPNPLFAGKQEGIFMLNSRGSLLFAIHPLKDPLSTRVEVLLEEIDAVEWNILQKALSLSVTQKDGRIDRYPLFPPIENKEGHPLRSSSL